MSLVLLSNILLDKISQESFSWPKGKGPITFSTSFVRGLLLPFRGVFKKILLVDLVGFLAWAYQETRPLPPNICGSKNGPPPTKPNSSGESREKTSPGIAQLLLPSTQSATPQIVPADPPNLHSLDYTVNESGSAGDEDTVMNYVSDQ